MHLKSITYTSPFEIWKISLTETLFTAQNYITVVEFAVILKGILRKVKQIDMKKLSLKNHMGFSLVHQYILQA